MLVLIAFATLASLFGFFEAWQISEVATSPIQIRPDGAQSTYMTFAGLLMMVEVLALAYLMFFQSTHKWTWVSIVIIFYCLLLTLTRQAWLGLLVGVICLVFFWKKKFLLLLPPLIIIIFLISPNSTKTRITETISPTISIKDWSLASRINLWQFGWKVFKDYPLTGCGFRCVDLIHNQYIDPFPKYHGSVRHLKGMHNNFIQIAVDTGILGLTAWLGIWVYFFWLLYRKATNLKPDTSERWIVFGSAATALAFHTGGIFEANFYDSEVAMLLYFIMALPFTGNQSIPKATSKV